MGLVMIGLNDWYDYQRKYVAISWTPECIISILEIGLISKTKLVFWVQNRKKSKIHIRNI